MKTRKKPGPLSTVSESKAKAIAVSIESDLTLEQSCRKAGVSRSAYYRAIGDYPEISARIKKALSAQQESIKEEASQTIRDAFKTDWKAAAWWLERNFSAEFGKVQPRRDVEGHTVRVIMESYEESPRYLQDLTGDPSASVIG